MIVVSGNTSLFKFSQVAAEVGEAKANDARMNAERAQESGARVTKGSSNPADIISQRFDALR